MGISEEPHPQVLDSGYPFERVLVPLDGSATAEKAFSLVRSLSRKHGVQVVLVNIVEPHPPEGSMTTDASIESAQTYLSQVASMLGSHGIDAEAIVRVGPVPQRLFDVAGEEGASLMAMSTQGGQTPDAAPFGAVAERLFESSPIPILAISSHARSVDPSQPFRTILLPVDPKEPSEAVARIAVEFAVSVGIDLAILLSVVPPTPTGRGDAEERVDAEEHLGRVASLFERQRISTVQRVQAGDPAREILRASSEQNADVIALGIGGRITQAVLKNSLLPVLAVHPSRAPRRSAKTGA
jgi:nucleotide-binding universal stress UspA family protein